LKGKFLNYLFVYLQGSKDLVYLEGLITKVEEVSAVDFLSVWNKAEDILSSSSQSEGLKEGLPEDS